MTRQYDIQGFRRKSFPLLLLLLITSPLTPLTLQAQTDTLLHGYQFSTGVDSTRWITLDPTNSTYTSYSYYYTLSCSIGFDFFYFGRKVNSLYVSQRGVLYLDNSYANETSATSIFSNDFYKNRAPAMMPFGNCTWGQYYGYSQMLGTADSHILVIEYHFGVDPYASINSATRSLQVQLHEADGSITFVYGEHTDSYITHTEVGLMGTPNKFIVVDQRNHTASTIAPNDVYGRGWPGERRYYHFTPSPCQSPIHLQAIVKSASSATISWANPYGSNRFLVEYDTAGFTPGTGHDTLVLGYECLLEGLEADATYDIYVSAYCPDSTLTPAALLQYTPRCDLVGNTPNRIPYWQLTGPNTNCRTGTFSTPNYYSTCMDFGPASALSRHTVHSDPTETDPRTNDTLYTVPPGQCRSVRLGNWGSGAEQEAIEYTLTVDTNDYDLLLLDYAIVEENPNHRVTEQPYFTFGIYNTNGTMVDSCYYANFVAGDLSGWHTIPGTIYNTVVWHDWHTVGVDLTPLHGQTIRIRLSNADCQLGGHFGYGYFTLRSASKNIRLDACGGMAASTLYAPKGFSYRWYSPDAPDSTLGTDDSLQVPADGYYCCDATYQLSGHNCSFTLKAYAGIRFPAAKFNTIFMEPCGTKVRFVNESFVAHDSAHTLTSTEPCEQYLWDFGDGTTSTLINPTHQFDTGDYIIRLYAMLGNGECIDSAQHILHVGDQRNVLYDTICYGGTRTFFDTVCTETGLYNHVEILNDCDITTTLQLVVLPNAEYHLSDTFMLGSTYLFGRELYTQPGVHQQHLTTPRGCDSLCVLRLSCMEHHDTLLCIDGLPINWRGHTFTTTSLDTLHLTCAGGTDSVVVLHLIARPHPTTDFEALPYCEEGGYYMVPLPDNALLYQWEAQPADSNLPQGLFVGSLYSEGVRLSPRTPTLYSVLTDYPDNPSCPIRDTLHLDPVPIVHSQLEVSPRWLWSGAPDLTALDLGDPSWRRLWYVNDDLQAETAPRLVYTATPFDDTLHIMLVNHSAVCTDTAKAIVPVKTQELWFPNVFTPDKPINNRFRGYGVHVMGYQLQVFTKWGDCIFSTYNLEEGWDGTYNGVRSPVSAYAYRCIYTTLDGERRTIVGTVTLLR